MYVANVYANAQLVRAGVCIENEIVVGRSPDCDVVVAEPSVSRRHLSIAVTKVGDQEIILLRDFESRNGVYVNSQRVSERMIAPGDSIRFGSCRLDLLRVESSSTSTEDIGSETIRCKWTPALKDPNVASRLRAVYSMALSLSDLEIPFMLEKAGEIVRACVDFDEFGLLLQGQSDMVLCTSWNRHGPCGKDEITVEQELIDSCINLGQPLVSVGVSRRRPGSDQDEKYFATCVPLIAAGRVLGVMYCSTWDDAQPFSQEEIQFLTIVACFVASGISHKWNLADVQKSAAKLEAILGSLKEGLVVCDPEFRIFSVNHAAREMLGRSSLIGLSLDEALEGFQHTFDPATIRSTSSFDMNRIPDGALDLAKIEAYRATLSSAVGETGGWLYVFCIRDVTGERRDELMQLAFVSRLAHKLRTPLTVMKSVTALVADDSPGSEELRRLIDSSCGEMSKLVDQFVDFASLDHEKTQIRSTVVPVSVRYLVQQSLTMAHDQIEASGVQVDVTAADVDCEIRVMSDRLCQCFVQIIENACKFAGENASLRIGVKIDGNITFSFEDDGPGVAPDELQSLFNLFHQIDEHETGEIPGIGLGLWWTREVVRVHGGDVLIESPVQDGGGLRVSIVLPEKIIGGVGSEPADETRDFCPWDFAGPRMDLKGI